MTIEQYDNLVDIASRMEQLLRLIDLYTADFASSTDVDKLVLGVQTRPRMFTIIGTLIFDLALESWERLDAAISDLPYPGRK